MTVYDAIKLIKKSFFGGTVLYDTHITSFPISSTDNGFICNISCEPMDISVDVLVTPNGVYLLTKLLRGRYEADLKGKYDSLMKGNQSESIRG